MLREPWTGDSRVLEGQVVIMAHVNLYKSFVRLQIQGPDFFQESAAIVVLH